MQHSWSLNYKHIRFQNNMHEKNNIWIKSQWKIKYSSWVAYSVILWGFLRWLIKWVCCFSPPRAGRSVSLLVAGGWRVGLSITLPSLTALYCQLIKISTLSQAEENLAKSRTIKMGWVWEKNFKKNSRLQASPVPALSKSSFFIFSFESMRNHLSFCLQSKNS